MKKQTIILPHRKYDPSHLEWVTTKMRSLGSPTIRAIWVDAYNAWVALEGTHRLVAAFNLGIPVDIDSIEYEPELTTVDIGQTADDWGGDVWTLEEIVDRAVQTCNSGGFVDVLVE